MQLNVIKGRNVLNFEVDPTETIIDLKNRIFTQEGLETNFQIIFYNGYWINEDDICLGDFLKNGDELVLNNDAPTKAVTGRFISVMQRTITIINPRSLRPFQTLLLVPSRETTIRLSTGKFGLVISTDNEGEIGRRSYQAEVYKLREDSEVRVVEVEGRIEVLINDIRQEPKRTKVYEEGILPRVRDGVSTVGNFIGNFGRFLNGIAEIINLADGAN